MKFTNRDGKLRLYDGTFSDVGDFTATGTATNEIAVTGAGWTVDEFAGIWLQVTSGAAISKFYRIDSNTDEVLTVSHGDPAADGMLSGDDFHIGHIIGIVTDVTAHTISVSGTWSWNVNEWAGYKAEMTTGAASGDKFRVTSNTAYVLTVAGDPLTAGVQAGDFFKIGGIPYFFEMCLDNGDFSAPVGIAKHEEILVLDRGRVSSCSHYISGTDASVMEPVAVTFTAMINDSQKFLNFLDLLEGNTVNGHTMESTKGAHERITAPYVQLLFADSTKKTYDVEYKMTGTTNSITYIYRECYFELSDLTYAEAEDGVNLSLSGMCYGTIERTSSFSEGIDVNA